MDRIQFIKSSILSFAAISSAPALVKAFDLGEMSKSIDLKENLHIRHGYYGNEYILNEFKDSFVKSIRIDRFLNPEGDMSLYELKLNNEKIRIAHTKDGLLIQTADKTLEIANNQESNQVWDMHGLTISTKPSIKSSNLYHLELGTNRISKGLSNQVDRNDRFYLSF